MTMPAGMNAVATSNMSDNPKATVTWYRVNAAGDMWSQEFVRDTEHYLFCLEVGRERRYKKHDSYGDWFACEVEAQAHSDMLKERRNATWAVRLKESVAPQLFEVLEEIMKALPSRRDWLDPALERRARELLTKIDGETQ